MAKYKSNLVKGIEEKREFEAEQRQLREKHNIKGEEDKIVVEKSNMTKFVVNNFINFIKIFATIVLLCLAAIGVIALVYPEIRVEVENVFTEIYNQLFSSL